MPSQKKKKKGEYAVGMKVEVEAVTQLPPRGLPCESSFGLGCTVPMQDQISSGRGRIGRDRGSRCGEEMRPNQDATGMMLGQGTGSREKR